MKRVNVIGTSGSGKSTFSRNLANALGCRYIEMDAVFWRPNWEEPNDEIFFADLEKIISAESWVLDGNYSRTQPLKWKHVDTVIWLDYGFLRTFYQVLFRSIKRAILKNELWQDTGNRESFRRAFLSKDSIVLWMLKHHKSNRIRYRSIFEGNNFPHVKFIRVASPREAQKILALAGSSSKATEVKFNT
jgi:adenylate kinase family enzyme